MSLLFLDLPTRLAPLVVLAEPFPPAQHESVCFVVFVVNIICEVLGIPDQHVVVDLLSLASQHQGRDQVGNPVGGEHLVVQNLFHFAFGLDVLNEEGGEDAGFEEDVNESRSHLHDSQVEEEELAEERQDDIVIDVGETEVFLVLVVFDHVVVELLLKLADVGVGMLEERGQVWVTAIFPHWHPTELQALDAGNHVFMDILEVENICAVLGDVLGMGVDGVLGKAPVAHPFLVLLHAGNLELRGGVLIDVQPQINETVSFLHVILPQLHVFLLAVLPIDFLTVVGTHIVVILHI